MKRNELENYLNTLLSAKDFNDYCPNGLQVEGQESVDRLISGVTACQDLIEAAIDRKAGAILVHHGYFWKGEDARLKGIKKKRIERLMEHNISLFAYHLPLDAHPEFGNNAQLAKLLGLEVTGAMEHLGNHGLGLVCKLPRPETADKLSEHFSSLLARKVEVLGPGEKKLHKLALCTGAAQSMFEEAIQQHGIDGYISGEVSEPTFHIAQEYEVSYFALGHHASERYGAKALGEHLAAKFGIEHEFIDIDNPV